MTLLMTMTDAFLLIMSESLYTVGRWRGEGGRAEGGERGRGEGGEREGRGRGGGGEREGKINIRQAPCALNRVKKS